MHSRGQVIERIIENRMGYFEAKNKQLKKISQSVHFIPALDYCIVSIYIYSLIKALLNHPNERRANP